MKISKIFESAPCYAACARPMLKHKFRTLPISRYDGGTSKEVVLENTLFRRSNRPVSAVLSCPNYVKSFGQDGLNGNASRTAQTSVFNILPILRLKTQVELKSRLRSMTMSSQATGTPVAASELSLATPELTNIDGQITTTSLQIAEHFGKRHADVLRAISKLECSAEFTERNFALSEFTDSTGRKLPCHRITKDGFMFLAMGFTGKEAAQWKEAYITAFNKMEAALTTRPMLVSTTISPAQAQHLRELVQLVVETGKQSHGETWARLQRKMKVNSYLMLRPDQFDAACEYLQGKFDDTSIASLIQKHLPQAVPALPAPTEPSLTMRRWLIYFDHTGREVVSSVPNDAFVVTVPELCHAVLSGEIKGKDFIDLAYAVNQRQYMVACNNPNRGYGQEVADKIKDLSAADLHIINQRATMEVWLRSKNPQRAAA